VISSSTPGGEVSSSSETECVKPIVTLSEAANDAAY